MSLGEDKGSGVVLTSVFSYLNDSPPLICRLSAPRPGTTDPLEADQANTEAKKSAWGR
jgi:hypothetical protein